jgi:hypothetical protein
MLLRPIPEGFWQDPPPQGEVPTTPVVCPK